VWIAVAVLIVTCPCALALATPVAMTVASGALARANVAVTRGRAIEALAGVTDVVFDKTGTLTTGEPSHVQVIPLPGCDRAGAIAIAAALAQGSSHPIDGALRIAADGIAALPAAHAHETVAGQGIEGVVGSRRYRLGRASFAMELCGQPAPIATLDSARSDTWAWLAGEQGWIAAFRFRDVPREDSRQAVRTLEDLGVKIHLLSGDDEAIVRATATTLGIGQAQSRATPEDKCATVRALQRHGARVAMVGDGINDAAVLAQADVSIAMDAGADLAKLNADAVLVSNAPGDLACAIRIARNARAVIRQNLGWALGYNVVVIPLAVTGHVSPLIAGLGMSLSSLLVVLNSLRAR
jgi:Cu2+-exporting ATPase